MEDLDLRKKNHTSFSGFSRSGGAIKTQLGFSVVCPIQSHALHSPLLTRSPSASSLIECTGSLTAAAQANTVHKVNSPE